MLFSILPFFMRCTQHSQYIMSLSVEARIEMLGRKLLDKQMTIIVIYNMLPVPASKTTDS